MAPHVGHDIRVTRVLSPTISVLTVTCFPEMYSLVLFSSLYLLGYYILTHNIYS